MIKYKLIECNNLYYMEVTQQGFPTVIDIRITKPTGRQVLLFLHIKKHNKASKGIYGRGHN